MKPDSVIIGGMAGFIGTIIKEILDFLNVLIGWSKYLYWHLAASVFVQPTAVNHPGALILGALGDLITGAMFGVILLYTIKLTGKDYLYIKGLAFGWLIWLGVFGLMMNIEIVRITPTDIGSNLCAFVEHSVFGISAAWFIGRYGKELID